MKIILLGGLLVWGLISVAQDRSIAFEDSSFGEALEKARQNKKLLFVDCYTSWCGPCKMLAREVFTNNEVADYFSEHFVSFKVDCEKGEGPELRKRFGVAGYPTLLFIDGEGKVVNKIVGASRQPTFLADVKKGLDPKTSLQTKEKEYEAGNRERDFVLDLIASYKRSNDVQKAKKVSLEFLASLSEEELFTEEGWEVIRYYYVSGYGSIWWNFILEHSDRYIKLVGKEAVAKKIGDTLHPYLFGYIYGRKKTDNRQDFKTYRTLVEQYQPKQKKTLNVFIELGESAGFDHFNGYFKTVMKVIPELDIREHYRFYSNAMEYLATNANASQKQQLLALLKESQLKENEYNKPLYQKFFDKIN